MNVAGADNTHTGRYIQVNDLDLYFVESGSGRPLILLHGGTDTMPDGIPSFLCWIPISA